MAFDATQIEVSGYMVKRGEVRRSFKRRFCVIYHDGILEYYQREEQRGSNLNTMLGHLDLSSALSVGRSCEKSLQTPELAIDVVTPTRTWVFIAETYTDFAAWLKAMRRFCPRDCNRLSLIYEGWLTKRGHVVRNWKARYVIIARGYLAYFFDEAECEKVKRVGGHSAEVFAQALEQYARGFFRLDHATVTKVGNVERRRHIFRIDVPNGNSTKRYLWQPSSAEDCDSWVDVIRVQLSGEHRLHLEGAVQERLAASTPGITDDLDERPTAPLS